MAAACRERERTPPSVPAIPSKAHLSTGVEQHRDDRQATPAADRMAQAPVSVDVDAAVKEPAQAGHILEVQLVVDDVLKAELVEKVQKRGARLLARAIKRILIARGSALQQQTGELEVVAFDGIEQHGHPTLAAPLDRMAVRVSARVKQQPRTAANVPR